MRPGRRLALRREAMGDLATDELRGVAAAYSPWPCPIVPTYGPTCVRCPSLPLTNCTILTETDSVTCPTDVC